MKAIKLSMVALATVLAFGFANAQVGVQAGYSSSKATSDGATSVSGFHVGPTYEMAIQGPISLQYALLYNMYFSKADATVGSGSTKTGAVVNGTSHQIDIPVRLAATFPLASGISAYVFGGPNFNIGVAANTSTKIYLAGVASDPVKANLYDDDNLSRFNLQLGVGAGLKYNNMGVKFSYDWGMLDMYKSDAVNYKVNGLKIGLTYNF